MAICNRCGCYIEWQEKKEGWRPYNKDGSEHFKKCNTPEWLDKEKESDIIRQEYIKHSSLPEIKRDEALRYKEFKNKLQKYV